MTKHTPGPWTVHVDKSGGDWEYTIRTVKPHNPAGRIGKHIATLNPYLCEGTGNELWPCVDHNARLIAAAPELLEAAKKALDFIHSLPYEPSIASSTKAQDSLVAAIAKAEGGAQ